MFRKYSIPFDLDDSSTTIAHKEIILNKPFLKRLYLNWYRVLAQRALKMVKGKHLEIGSGGGFLKEVFPDVITSDIQYLPGVDYVFSAESLPFEDEELCSIVMLNVFHHIPKPYLFLAEVQRTLISKGVVVMIEPANSNLGRYIYKRFHHEPFDENGPREIAPGNPLSNSNQALPYIYFERDALIFRKEFPLLTLKSINYHSPFSYILSGGLSRSALLPGFMFPLVRCVEWLLSPFNRQLGLFCTIELEKR